MLDFANKYFRNVHSQNGEDGIIAEALRRIKPEKKTAIEFGAPTFYYCSNTALLADQGWNVKMFDIDDNIDVRIKQAIITPDNVNEYVGEPTVLSIDVDGQDYWIWSAYNGKPDIVVIEINSSIPPPIFEVPGDRGSSYTAMTILGISKGYFLLCHTGNNIFCLEKHRHLFPEIIGDGLSNSELYFNRSFL